jgi:hypothetical protein
MDISNEAAFCISGRVNHHNCRIPGSDNLNDIQDIERHGAKLNICFAVTCHDRCARLSCLALCTINFMHNKT